MKFSIFLFLVLMAPCALAAEDMISLFFTPDEMTRINKEIQNSREARQAKHLIHLGSLVYFGPDRWVIWLQGKKWTPETDNENIQILDVTPDSARLLLHLANKTQEKEITLHPHQSFNLLTGEVEEGF